MVSKFNRKGCFTCRLCWKKTRQVNNDGHESAGLCVKCFDNCSMENCHSDNGHDGDVKGCVRCKDDHGLEWKD